MTVSVPMDRIPDKENILIWTPFYKSLIFKETNRKTEHFHDTNRMSFVNHSHFAVEEKSFFEYKIIKNRWGPQNETIDRNQLEKTILGQFQHAYQDDFLNAQRAWDNGLRGQAFTWALQINGCDLNVLRYIQHWLTTGSII